jgi:hypothetical protein
MDFLLQTAEIVDKWILDKAIMERFKEQARIFYNNVKKYDKEKQGEDPWNWLVLPYPTLSDAHIGLLMSDDYPKHKKIRLNKNESLLVDYVLLTIIHDKRLENPSILCISESIWLKDDEWFNEQVGLKWEKLQRGNQSDGIQTHVKLALEHVEADLAKGHRCKRIISWIFTHFITVIVSIFIAVITAIVLKILANHGWL